MDHVRQRARKRCAAASLGMCWVASGESDTIERARDTELRPAAESQPCDASARAVTESTSGSELSKVCASDFAREQPGTDAMAKCRRESR